MRTTTAPLPPHPEGRAAVAPPEARGLDRDGVRLLVARTGGVTHARFRDLGRFLRQGDLLVFNTSRTLPAAVAGMRGDGRPTTVHFSTRLDDGTWAVELRRPDNSGPMLDATAGEEIETAGGRRITILSAYPGIEGRSRLVRCRLQPESSSKTVLEYLGRFGRPITYAYIQQRWPLTAYQTVFATEPGSAEMPSAGRPFTDRLVTQLLAAGVRFAPILLHTGVSSLELGELPAPEPFRVPQTTADLVNFTHSSGGRVVAVGTTVTRALESAADELGYVSAVEGWTDLVLEASRPARAVEGLITGWHTATATHLDLLEAVANAPVVRQAYDAAVSLDYLWHEFGDSCLLLPDRDAIW